MQFTIRKICEKIHAEESPNCFAIEKHYDRTSVDT